MPINPLQKKSPIEAHHFSPSDEPRLSPPGYVARKPKSPLHSNGFGEKLERPERPEMVPERPESRRSCREDDEMSQMFERPHAQLFDRPESRRGPRDERDMSEMLDRPERSTGPFFENTQRPEMNGMPDVRPDRPMGPLFDRVQRPEDIGGPDSPKVMPERPSGPEPVEAEKSVKTESMADKKRAWEERRARVKQGKAGKVKYGDVIRQNHEQFLVDADGDQQPNIACTLSSPIPAPQEPPRQDEPLAPQPPIARNKTVGGQAEPEDVEYSAAQKWEERRRRKLEDKKKGVVSNYGAHLRSMYEDNTKDVVRSPEEGSQEHTSRVPEQWNKSTESLEDLEPIAHSFTFGEHYGQQKKAPQADDEPAV
jgi:hypothetical protein